VKQILNVMESAEMLRVRPVTIRKWIYEGKVPFLKLGRRVFIKLNDIEAFMDENYHPARKEKMCE